MKSKGNIFIGIMFAIAGLAGILISCAKNTDGSAPAANANSYQGPGSHYTVSSSGSTYTFNKYSNAAATSADFTVTATASDINGFKKFTVTNVSGSGGPTVGGPAIYGFEVPGMALFVKPLDASNPDQVLVAVASGQCPTATFNANYIKVKVKSGDDLSSANIDSFGTFTYTPGSGSSGTATLPAKFSLNAPTSVCNTCGSNSFSAASCSGGIMRVANVSDYITIYLSTTGAAIVNTSDQAANMNFIFGMPQPSSVVTSVFAGTYSGLYYSAAGTAGSRLKPIKATLTAPDATHISGSGNELSSVDNDTTTGGAATLSLTVNNSYPGILTGSLTTSGTTNIACLVMPNANGSGKQVLDCAGIDPGVAGGLFNFLLVSR